MVIKNYYIRTELNMKSEIQYIADSYSTPEQRAVGLYNSNIIRAKLDLANESDFIVDMASRNCKGLWIETTQIDLSLYQKSALDNRVIFQFTQNIALNALSVSYVDVFPALYSGLPIPFDTTGYKKMGMVLLWNKNGGAGTHTIKLSKCNANGVLLNPEQILRETNVPTGYLSDFNYTIPQDFIDYVGFIKLQAKSSNGTDNPRIDGLWLYMIRR